MFVRKWTFKQKWGCVSLTTSFFQCRQVKDPFAPQPLQSTWTYIFSFGFDWLVEMALREGHGWSWCWRHSTQFQSSFTRPHWVLPSKTPCWNPTQLRGCNRNVKAMIQRFYDPASGSVLIGSAAQQTGPSKRKTKENIARKFPTWSFWASMFKEFLRCFTIIDQPQTWWDSWDRSKWKTFEQSEHQAKDQRFLKITFKKYLSKVFVGIHP